MTENQQTLDSRALRAVAVQFLINGMVAASFIPRLPEIRDALGVDLATIGQILTVASLGGLLGSWLSGWVMPKFGTKNAMIYGTLAVILTLPLVGFTSSVWSLLMVLAFITMLDPIVDVAMNIQGSNISARRDTPVMNRLHGLWSVGSVIGGLLAAGMAALTVSLQWHLIGAACLMAVGLWYIGGGLLTSDQAVKDPNETTGTPSAKARIPTSLWIYAALGASAIIPEMIGSDWAPFRAKDDLQLSAGVAGMAYVAFTSGMVAGRLSGDWIAMKLGKEKLLNYAIVTAVIGLATACLIDYTPLVFLGLCIAGIGISVLFPALYDAAAQDPDNPGAALGAMTAGSRGVMLIAPVSIGLLADTETFSVGMAMAMLALPCLFILVYLSGKIARPTQKK